MPPGRLDQRFKDNIGTLTRLQNEQSLDCRARGIRGGRPAQAMDEIRRVFTSTRVYNLSRSVVDLEYWSARKQ